MAAMHGKGNECVSRGSEGAGLSVGVGGGWHKASVWGGGETIMSKETNIHGDTLCFMVMWPSLLQRLAVGGPWGLSLGAVLNKKKSGRGNKFHMTAQDLPDYQRA